MRKTILAIVAFTTIFSSCKVIEDLTGKSKAKEQTEVKSQPKVFSVKEEKPAVRENPVSDQMYVKADSKPISIRKENFSFSEKEDKESNANKNFFVIVGSFSNYENAGKLKTELKPQGFNPIILKSETGYYRVCVNSYTDETDARSKVHEIRQNFPNFNDCWLLIKN